MKMTLLELTQACLRSIKGEEVNSISDTAESLAVADIIKESYYTLVSQKDYPELYTLFELDASGDSAKPTLMTLPSGIIGLEWIKYNKRLSTDPNDKYSDLIYLPLKTFLDFNHMINTSESNTGSFTLTTVNNSSITFYYRNDIAPTYYTSFDDFNLVFDSYDSVVNTTLVKDKTQCFGLKEDTWSNIDSFTPLLDSQQFITLLNKAKAMTWLELRQTQNPIAERTARKGRNPGGV